MNARPILLLIALAIGLVSRAAAASGDGGCSTASTALYFGNGVNVTYDKALETVTDKLPSLAAEANIGKVEFGVAYNHTDGLIADIIQTAQQKQAEDSRFNWFLLNNIAFDLLEGLNVLNILKLPPGGSALVATLQNVISAGIVASDDQTGTFYDSDVADQVSGYEADFQAGYRVIVVANSQGNLYANACHAAIAASSSTSLASFGIVAVADPAEIAFNEYETSYNDVVINLLRAVKPVLPANLDIPKNLSDLTGHMFTNYINPKLPGRAAVVELLSSVATALPYPQAATTACESDGGETEGAVPETDAEPEPEDSASESSGCEEEDGGSSCEVAPAQCTDFATPGCIDFQGAIESGGDSRNTAAGSLSIDLGSDGYCLQSPCEFEDCYVCPHLDTAFPEGATVTATATPSAGSVFAQWGQGACAGQGPTCTFVAVTPSCITAQFLLQNPTAPPQSLPDASCPEDPTAP